MHPSLAHPLMLAALSALPVLSVLAALAARRRQRALVALGGLALGAVLSRRRPSRLRALIGWLGMVLLAIGMAGPRWGRDWSQSAAPAATWSSWSISAEACMPRLPRVWNLPALPCSTWPAPYGCAGDIGSALVVFAGKPRLVCPLTHDLDHFRDRVEAIDVAAPDTELGTGTRIGSVLALAVDTHEGRSAAGARHPLALRWRRSRRDGEYRAGIDRAPCRRNPRVLRRGLGDAAGLHGIPATGGWLMHDGKEVQTLREDAPLREIAHRTNGQLILAGTQTLALGDYYLGLATTRAGDEDSPDALPVYRQRQTWFLLPAFVLLLAHLAHSRNPCEEDAMIAQSLVVGRLAGAALAGRAIGFRARRRCPTAKGERRLSRRGAWAEAAALYDQAGDRTTEPGLVAFNLATAKYHLAREGNAQALADAEQAYRCCLEPGDPRRAQALFGLGNCLLLRAGGSSLDRVSLRSAIDRFGECLRDPGCVPPLAADARHNRLRARLLLLQMPPPRDGSTDDPGSDDPKDDQPEDGKNPEERSRGIGDDKGTQAGTPFKGSADPSAGENQGTPSAGRGAALPPVPDQAVASPLATRDALEHLQMATQRILDESRQHRRSRSRPAASGVRDW